MERIWYENIIGFISVDNYFVIWPSKEMTFAEQLNCLLRFSIYFAIIVLVIKKDVNILFVPISVAFFTYYVYFIDTKNKSHEKFVMDSLDIVKDPKTGRTCQKPTRDNPFMNVLMTDYSKRPDRKQACSINGHVKRQMKQYFDKSLYRDVDDIYHKNASDRQFYTTPITTIPNDQTAFAKWLYGSGPTCKEGNGFSCYRNMSR